MSGVGNLVLSGPLILAVPVALAAGAVTFLSPCCLPLVPGYLSYVTGMSGTSGDEAGVSGAEPAGPELAGPELAKADADRASVAGGKFAGSSQATAAAVAVAGPDGFDGSGPGGSAGTAGQTAAPARAPGPARGRVVAGAALFVLGFSLLFASEGVLLGGIGEKLLSHAQIVDRVLGGVTILLGLMFAGAFDRFLLAGRIVRPSWRPQAGLAGAPLLGVMFGLTWTPCIGPTLSAVLGLAGTSGTAVRGAILAFTYGAGLGIPFLMVAFAFQRGMNVFSFAKRHARLITAVGGLMLVTVGVLEVTGTWQTATSWMQVHWTSSYTSPI